jgi:hypothetical protein
MDLTGFWTSGLSVWNQVMGVRAGRMATNAARLKKVRDVRQDCLSRRSIGASSPIWRARASHGNIANIYRSGD